MVFVTVVLYHSFGGCQGLVFRPASACPGRFPRIPVGCCLWRGIGGGLAVYNSVLIAQLWRGAAAGLYGCGYSPKCVIVGTPKAQWGGGAIWLPLRLAAGHGWAHLSIFQLGVGFDLSLPHHVARLPAFIGRYATYDTKTILTFWGKNLLKL